MSNSQKHKKYNPRHKELIQKSQSELEKTLRRQPSQIPELCKQYLKDNVAKPLHSAVESTFRKTMGVNFADLFKTLQRLDQDIYKLQLMQKSTNARKSLYEERARYLTMVMPDPEMVKRLASELFRDEQLENIRRYVSKFQVGGSLSEISFVEFRAFFRSHRLTTEPEFVEEVVKRPPPPTLSGAVSNQRKQLGSVESKSFQTQASSDSRLRKLFGLCSFWLQRFRNFFMWLSTSIARFVWFVFLRVARFVWFVFLKIARFAWFVFLGIANVGFRKKLLSPNLEAVTALDLLQVDEMLVNKFSEYVFQDSSEEILLIKQIEMLIEEHIPAMNSSEFARRFCEKIVEEFKSIINDKKRQFTIRARIPVFSLGRLVLLRGLPPWVFLGVPLFVIVPALVVQIGSGMSWPLQLLIGLFLVISLVGTISFFWARRQLRRAVEQELIKLVSVLVEKTITSTSDRVTDPNWISTVVKDIDVQLRSRPLQRALDGSLE